MNRTRKFVVNPHFLFQIPAIVCFTFRNNNLINKCIYDGTGQLSNTLVVGRDTKEKGVSTETYLNLQDAKAIKSPGVLLY